MSFAVEVNGFQHKLLREQRKRDTFKKRKCRENSVQLFVVKGSPQFLLKEMALVLIERKIGVRFDLNTLPHSLRLKIKQYQPKHLKFGKMVREKAKYEQYDDLQEEENKENRIRMEFRRKKDV